MTQEQFEKTVKMIGSDHLIRMYNGQYINEFASVYVDDDEWMIESNVLAPRKLIDVNFSDLSFYKLVQVIA